jgi:hypothetical protein
MFFYQLHFFSQGFGDRLLSEIKKLAPKNMKLKVNIIQNCLKILNQYYELFYFTFFVKFITVIYLYKQQ